MKRVIDFVEVGLYIALALFVAWVCLWDPIHRAWVKYFWREVDGKFVRRKFFKKPKG